MWRWGVVASMFRFAWDHKWFLTLIYAPLAIACSVAAYQFGFVWAYVWFRSNGGTLSYAAQREIEHNLLWLKADIETYQKKHGTLPKRLAEVDLAAFREHGEPVLLDGQGRPLDPWGRPFLYAVKAGEIDLRSLGRDGRPGGTRLDADVSLDQVTWYYKLPSLQEFLRDQAEMPERSETPEITGFCAACPLLVFAAALFSRFRGPRRLHVALWVPAVTAAALVVGLLGGPILFLFTMAYVILVTLIGIFLSLVWLIICFCFGLPLPPISDH
jgi:Type II secretion system (T2SS), protein G